MNKAIVHNRIGIAIPTVSELTHYGSRTLDPEAQKLDPVAGPCINPMIFLIYKVEDEEVIGICVLYNHYNHNNHITIPQQQEGQVEFGIRIWNRRDWNKGYGSEATECTCLYAFGVLGVGRVVLKVLPFNIRAIKSYEKAGFERCTYEVIDSYAFLWMELLRGKN